jgi:formylglycine-generating enzyme required for sulfatase activity
MKCQQCQRDWPDEFEFCPKCGVPIVALQASDDSAAAAERGIALVGERPIAFSGDIHGDVSIVQEEPDRADPAALRHAHPDALEAAYLRKVQAACNTLPLAVIDPRAVERTRKQTMDLLAVYVALNTQTQVVEDEEESRGKVRRRRAKEADPDEVPDWLAELRPDREARLLSALEAVDGERQMVLLGDPGGGKSTFASHLALCLAGARLEELGEPADLPGDGWLAHLEPAWSHGPRLPLRVTLRHFAASERCDGTAGGFWSYLHGNLAAEGLADFAPHLRKRLLDGGVLVVCDGLDEVADPEQRRAVRDAVADFAALYGHPANRYLVTCRVYAYQDPRWQLGRFAAHTLAAFSQAQVDAFVDCWYREVCRLGWKTEVEARDLTGRLQAATRRADLTPLARSPLQLTMMASLHFSWGRLPDDRAELYQQMVDLLLVRWQEGRLGEETGVSQVIGGGDLVSVLEQVAFEAHRAQEARDGPADVGEGVLLGVLKDFLGGDWGQAQELLAYIRERAGLLLEREPGVYTFPHRSYQEYLAGSYLARDPEFPDLAADLLRENYAQWREVVLWAVGVMARLKRMTHVAVNVADALCPQRLAEGSIPETDWRAAHLAGEALLETGVKEVRARERHAPVLDRVQRRLVALLDSGALLARERAETGDTLARLDDPRPGVGLRPDGLPDIVWCEVPAGPFLMGTEEQNIAALQEKYRGDISWYKREVPRREVALPTFHIARYPVTVAQFDAFVAAGGYGERRYWPEAEAAGHWRDGRVTMWRDEEPRDRPTYPGEPFNLPNHPVVNVSWYEALAFCRWLSERMAEEGSAMKVWREGQVEPFQPSAGAGLQVRLPTEAEWEKAARGRDGREYPWGDEFDANRCNVGETRIGSTSTVGLFPDGVSPCGALDMSGNVWEWCHSLYKPYPYQAGDGREDLEAEGARVLRGGAFGSNQGIARCASRYYDAPGRYWYGSGFRLVVAPALPF